MDILNNNLLFKRGLAVFDFVYILQKQRDISWEIGTSLLEMGRLLTVRPRVLEEDYFMIVELVMCNPNAL